VTMSKLVLVAMLVTFSQPAAAVEPPQNFAVHEAPVPVPEIRFEDGNGQPKTLADFSGKIVLLNIWATWCAPCRKEMPTLDRLQAKLGGPDFEVVALSMDRAGPDKVKKFFAEIGIEHLALNIDTSGKAMFTLGALGLPMTLLIDREGKEIGRLIGPAEWDAPEMVDFIRSYFAAN
jgi:thiol-disulfide isomerase/thioredoxin